MNWPWLAAPVLLLCLLPLSASGLGSTENEPGWVALKVTPDVAGFITLNVWREREGEGAIGIEIRSKSSASQFLMTSPGTVTSVGTSVTGPSLVVPMESGLWTLSVEYRSPVNDPLQVLVWGVGRTTVWGYAIDTGAQGNTEIIASGPGGIFSDGSGRGEALHAHVVADSVGVAVSQAVYSIEFNETFRGLIGLKSQDLRLGAAGTVPTAHEDIFVTFPDSSTELCPCFGGTDARWTPGDYMITWEGASIFAGDQTVLAAGIDAPKWMLD